MAFHQALDCLIRINIGFANFGEKEPSRVTEHELKGRKGQLCVITEQRCYWAPTTALPHPAGMSPGQGILLNLPFLLGSTDTTQLPGRQGSGQRVSERGTEQELRASSCPSLPLLELLLALLPSRRSPSPLRTQGDSSARTSLTAAAAVGLVTGASWQVP